MSTRQDSRTFCALWRASCSVQGTSLQRRSLWCAEVGNCSQTSRNVHVACVARDGGRSGGKSLNKAEFNDCHLTPPPCVGRCLIANRNSEVCLASVASQAERKRLTPTVFVFWQSLANNQDVLCCQIWVWSEMKTAQCSVTWHVVNGTLSGNNCSKCKWVFKIFVRGQSSSTPRVFSYNKTCMTFTVGLCDCGTAEVDLPYTE